ncbi:hypothetical protein D3C87_1799030 [compost metagenome]
MCAAITLRRRYPAKNILQILSDGKPGTDAFPFGVIQSPHLPGDFGSDLFSLRYKPLTKRRKQATGGDMVTSIPYHALSERPTRKE